MSVYRLEKLKIREMAGKAKVFGTFICVGGAMLLSFYNGPLLHVPKSDIHWEFVQETSEGNSVHKSSFLGPLLVIAGCVSYSVWLIVQARSCLNLKFH